MVKYVEGEIYRSLPNLFGLIIDGWSDMSTSTHFLGIFALYPGQLNEQKRALLTFSPLLDETTLTADSHIDLIDFALTVFGKNRSNVGFLICDNDNLNKSISRKLALPMNLAKTAIQRF